MKKEKNIKNDKYNNSALFITFLTLAWIVFLFPESVGNFYPEFIAKFLVIVGTLFISTFGNEETKQLYGNLGVGLGFLIIWVAFVNDLPNNWLFRIPFFLFFGMFGLFGTYQALIAKISNLVKCGKELNNYENNEKISYNSKHVLFKIIIQIVEVLAALATILQFVGIEF